MMAILIILGLLLGITGLIGCVLAPIPGPFFSFAALCLVYLSKSQDFLSTPFMFVMGALMLLVTLLDYILPVAAARRYGASRGGLWGSVIGMMLGMFLFPPLGVFIGALLGAVIGELISGKMIRHAMGSGWGIFVGNMLSTGLKLAYSTFILFLCIKALFI